MWYSVFGIRYSVFGIRYSVFGIRYSVFGIRYSINGNQTKNQLPTYAREELVILLVALASLSYDSLECIGSPSALASEGVELGIPSRRCITISGLVSL